MDIQVHIKISVLLEKIHYLQQSIQQNGGMVSKVDKDLLVNYVRELYELTLAMPVAGAPQMYPPQQNYPYPPPAGQQPYIQQSGYQQPQQQQYPPQQPPAPQDQNPFIQNQGSLSTPPPVNNGTNGNYVNGNNGNNGNGSQQQLNAAFTFTNGKRSLSDSIKIKTGNEKPSLNEQFKRQEPEMAGKIQSSPIKDLKTFIGLNKRFSFINYLFGNDANLYDEAIERINSSKNLTDAQIYIQNNLISRLNWNDNNDMVAEFTQLVERRFMI